MKATIPINKPRLINLKRRKTEAVLDYIDYDKLSTIVASLGRSSEGQLSNLDLDYRNQPSNSKCIFITPRTTMKFVRQQILILAQLRHPFESTLCLAQAAATWLGCGEIFFNLLNLMLQGRFESPFDLQETFNLKATIDEDSNDISLARIAMCFPSITALVASGMNFRGSAPVLHNFPYCMRNITFAGLIPFKGSTFSERNDLETLRDAYTFFMATVEIHQALEDKKMSSKLLRETRITVLENLNRCPATNEERWNLLKNVTFLDVYRFGQLNCTIEYYAKLYQDCTNSMDQLKQLELESLISEGSIDLDVDPREIGAYLKNEDGDHGDVVMASCVECNSDDQGSFHPDESSFTLRNYLNTLTSLDIN